jgi:HSP20 family protein
MAVERWRPFGTSVARWEPVQGLGDIQQEMNRLFDSFFGRPSMAQATERIWIPLVDLHETKDDVVVTFEVPGVREKEIHLSITGDLLTVRGERKWEREQEATFHRVERAYGKFERTVPLPVPVQSAKVKATYRDGLLEVTLPKAEEVKPREIKVDIL